MFSPLPPAGTSADVSAISASPGAYVFRAGLLCESCADAVIVNCQLIDTGESSDYPQGPYPNGGGEADSPQRCDRCEVFLRNPLTTEGLDYVRRALKDALGQDYARRVWEPFYREALQAPRGWSHV